MKAVSLPAARRDFSIEARHLRANGHLPGVIYGKGIESQKVSVPRPEFIRLLHSHGTHALVTLKIEGGNDYLALVKEVQIDPVRQLALHVDFLRVQEDKPVHTEVVLQIVGEAAGVKLGGILEEHTRSISIEVLPMAIPESITFDVSGLEIGSVTRVSDLVAPEGVTILTDPEEILVAVSAPRTEEEPVAAEGEEAEAAEGEAPAEGDQPKAEETESS